MPAAFAGAQDAFPPGPARDTVALVCSQCHPLTRIIDNRKSASEWEALLYDMVSRGATLYEDELEPVKAYLIDNFSADAP